MKRFVASLGLGLTLLACAGPQRAQVDLRSELPAESRQACATVVTFFATWCFPCLAQLEILRSVHADLAPRGLYVEAVAMDLEGERVVAPFIQQSSLPFVVKLAGQQLREGQTPFGPIKGLPSTFIAGHDGRAVEAWEGVAKPEELRKALAPLLASERATDLKRLSCPASGDW